MATAVSGEWRQWREDVARACFERAPALLKEWLPQGRLENGTFKAGSLSGDKGRSLTIWLDKGNWKDFGNEADKGGNLVSLYARVRGIEYRAANDELAERFDIPKPALRRTQQWIPITPIPDFAPVDEQGIPKLNFALPGTLSGIWPYFDTEFQILYYRVRLETENGKQFRPITFCRNQETGECAWQLLDLKAPRPLYGLELLEVMSDAPVLIVEGEKTADAARKLLPAWAVVTFGSSSVSGKNTDWTPLLNRDSRLVVWPDNDQPGLKAAVEIASILEGRVEIVQPDSAWRQHWDLADALADGWTTTHTLEYLEGHIIKPSTTHQRVECEISGSDLEVRSRSIFNAIDTVQKSQPSLFQADGELAVIQNDLRLPADIPRLRQWLTSRINFQGRDREGNLRPVTPSDTLLENISVYFPNPLPRLKRLIRRPAFSSTRELINRPGHDQATGLFYIPGRGLDDLQPGEDVDGAIALIDDLFCDFKFDSASDRAHLYALLLQPAFRELIEGPTPLYRFEAPQPGSGKTLLFETCAALLFEAGWPFITTPSSEEEWGKALLGHLRNGPEVLLIDNCHELKSYHLAAALTAWPYWSGRLLYQQGSFHVPVRNLWVATMNNPQFSTEMYRRTVRIRITTADYERPEARTGFRHDPILGYVAANKRDLATALLTLAVAAEKGLKPFMARRLGSYESWTQIMGGALEALGIEHFLEHEDDFGEDSQQAAWAHFITSWAKDSLIAGRPCRVKDLLTTAQDTDLDLGQGKDIAQQTRLGRLLHRHRDTTTAGLKLRASRDSHTKNFTYQLLRVAQGEEEANDDEGRF